MYGKLPDCLSVIGPQPLTILDCLVEKEYTYFIWKVWTFRVGWRKQANTLFRLPNDISSQYKALAAKGAFEANADALLL